MGVDICQESSGNKRCAQDDTGMGTSSAQHLYWIMKQPGSWVDLDLICRTERAGSRLVTFESQRENDCVTKYIIKEFTDGTESLPLNFKQTKMLKQCHSKTGQCHLQ